MSAEGCCIGMMSRVIPVRVDQVLFDAAKATAAVSSRSATRQVNHWARTGRELESSPDASARDIQNVLTGRSSYDDVGDPDQAVVGVARPRR